ncbi:hypothetical protein GCM10020219_046580 [Nonomuraea dietziae]
MLIYRWVAKLGPILLAMANGFFFLHAWTGQALAHAADAHPVRACSSLPSRRLPPDWLERPNCRSTGHGGERHGPTPSCSRGGRRRPLLARDAMTRAARSTALTATGLLEGILAGCVLTACAIAGQPADVYAAVAGRST